MPYLTCAVHGCKSASNINKGMRFHRFPKDRRYKLWVAACRRRDMKYKTQQQLCKFRICGLHFERRMFKNTILLKSSAIPVLNIPQEAPRPTLCAASTQTDFPKLYEGTTYSRTQKQSVTSTMNLITKSQSTQTTESFTDYTPIKKAEPESIDMTPESFTDYTPIKKEEPESMDMTPESFTAYTPVKKEEPESMDMTPEQFMHACDTFLSPNLRSIVKKQFEIYTNSK